MVEEICENCINLYLQDNGISSGNSHNFKQESFYPHFDCHRHKKIESCRRITDISSGYTTPINNIYVKFPCEEGLPRIFISRYELNKLGFNHQRIVGRGVDFDSGLAEIKSKAETIERICAYLSPRSRFHYGSKENFSKHILPIHKNISNEDRWWVETLAVKEYFIGLKKIIYIPLEYCQLSSVSHILNPIVQGTSTGMAVHTDKNEAILNGIFEVYEKFFLYAIWKNKKLIEKYKLFHLPSKYDLIIKKIKKLGYSVEILKVSHQEVIYAILVVIFDKTLGGEKPALIWGSGASFSEFSALHQALLEAYAQLIHAIENWELLEKSKGINSIYDTFIFYCYVENAISFIEYFGINKLKPTKSFNAKTEMITTKEMISKISSEMLFIDRGNALTDFLALHAIQAVIPDIYPPLTKENKNISITCPFV